MHREREYPDFPFVGVGALIHKEGKILLIRRKYEPNKGRWALPGGLVETGETTEEAAVREVREELGIGVKLEGLMDIANEIIRDGDGRIRYQYVLVDYLARPGDGRIRLNKESSSYRWIRPERVENLNTSNNTRAIVRKYMQSEYAPNTIV